MTIRNALDIAEAGKQVAIIGSTAHHLASDAAALAIVNPAVRTISRANGAQSITFTSGGRLTFHRTTQDVRGRTLDAAYLTSIRDARPDVLDELAPCFATTGSPRIGALI
jgi:hypothetical protein